jgi:hypothetical protein
MASEFDRITEEQRELIEGAPLFFIASAHPGLEAGPEGQGPVNVSPKGGVRLLVLDDHHVAYLDYGGSGNETARHAAASGPATVMVMSTSEDAAIVRLYGRATVTPLSESPLKERVLAGAEPTTSIGLGHRQVVEVEVDSTATSCGYGVPLLELRAQRTKGEHGRRYKESG